MGRKKRRTRPRRPAHGDCRNCGEINFRKPSARPVSFRHYARYSMIIVRGPRIDFERVTIIIGPPRNFTNFTSNYVRASSIYRTAKNQSVRYFHTYIYTYLLHTICTSVYTTSNAPNDKTNRAYIRVILTIITWANHSRRRVRHPNNGKEGGDYRDTPKASAETREPDGKDHGYGHRGPGRKRKRSSGTLPRDWGNELPNFPSSPLALGASFCRRDGRKEVYVCMDGRVARASGLPVCLPSTVGRAAGFARNNIGDNDARAWEGYARGAYKRYSYPRPSYYHRYYVSSNAETIARRIRNRRLSRFVG